MFPASDVFWPEIYAGRLNSRKRSCVIWPFVFEELWRFSIHCVSFILRRRSTTGESGYSPADWKGAVHHVLRRITKALRCLSLSLPHPYTPHHTSPPEHHHVTPGSLWGASASIHCAPRLSFTVSPSHDARSRCAPPLHRLRATTQMNVRLHPLTQWPFAWARCGGHCSRGV